MPQAVAAAIFKAFVVESWKALVIKMLVYSAVTFALNKVITALTPRPKTGETRGMEASVVDSSADGRILYGEVRSSGINVIPPWTSGDSNRYLHQILAVAVHEVDAITDVYFDQDTISSAAISSVTGSSNDGKVTSGKFKDAAWIRRYVGTAAQTVDFILNAAFPATWTADARGRGIAYVALQYDYGDGKVYTGIPQITFKVRGKKCYDPRLDTSPGANPTNAVYAAWTENPALCWADYKMATYGRNVAATEIDWSSVVTAADECDELVAIPGSLTQKRYTCNGLLLANNDPNDNEKKLLDSMMGRMVYLRGKWTVYAGSWQAPSASIDKADWASLGAVQTTASRDGGRYNGVRVYHVDPQRNWQRVESYPRFSDTYRTADNNERIWIEMEQPLCTNAFEAQRKAEILLRASRNGVRISGTLPPRFMLLAPWETVTVTFDELGWVSKTFRIVTTTPNPDGSIEVALVEEQSGDWTDMAAGDYNNPSVAALPAANPTTPSEPRNLVIEPQQGLLRFDWDEPTVKPDGTRYRILVGASSYTAPESRAVIFDGTATDALYPVLNTASAQYYYAQAYAGSYFSGYTPSTYGVQVIPLFGGVEQRKNALTVTNTGACARSFGLEVGGFRVRGGLLKAIYEYGVAGTKNVTWAQVSSWPGMGPPVPVMPDFQYQQVQLQRRINSGAWTHVGSAIAPAVWYGLNPASSRDTGIDWYLEMNELVSERNVARAKLVYEHDEPSTQTSDFYEYRLTTWNTDSGTADSILAAAINTYILTTTYAPLHQAPIVETLNLTVLETLGVPAEAPLDSTEYVRKNGAWIAVPGKVLVQSSWLGSQAARQSTFTYTDITSVCARGLSSRLLIGATDGQPLYDIEVRNVANSSGDLFLRAIGITEKQYEASIPFYYETNSGASIYVGIRNRAANASSYNLNMLRVEKFA